MRITHIDAMEKVSTSHRADLMKYVYVNASQTKHGHLIRFENRPLGKDEILTVSPQQGELYYLFVSHGTYECNHEALNQFDFVSTEEPIDLRCKEPGDIHILVWQNN